MLRVTNDSPVAATVEQDGSTLTITVPSGHAVRITEAVELPMPPPCFRVGLPPNVIRCPIEPANFGPGVTFTADRITPPTPTPAPTPQMVTIPGSATVPPGGSVVFRRPSDGATLAVAYGGREPAAMAYDGAVLTVTVPPLPPGQLLSGTVPGQGPGATCALVDDQRHVLRCAVQPAVGGMELLIGILITDPPPTPSPTATPGATETVALVAGCTNVSLTWPDGTPTGAVARAITPPAALVAVWRYDAAQRRFLAFSPRSAQASDLPTVNRLDAVFICMSGPGTLARPVLGAALPPGAATVIRAVTAGDADALAALARYTEMPCIAAPQGAGAPPLCAAAGTLPGSTVPTLPALLCEGEYLLRSVVPQFLRQQLERGEYEFHGVLGVGVQPYAFPAGFPEVSSWPTPQYAVVFRAMAPSALDLGFYLADGNIVALRSFGTCGPPLPPPDATAWLVPPRR